jgi:hypothetical protein
MENAMAPTLQKRMDVEEKCGRRQLMLVDIVSTTSDLSSILRVIKLCYEYCFLQGRKEAGLRLSSVDDNRLLSLTRLLEGDSLGPGQKRRHRRLPVILPVILKTPAGQRRGMLLNISGNGMFIATAERLEKGTAVQVRIGKVGQVEYSFPCTVQWQSSKNGGGVGLHISGTPLEVRHG